jgi:hypothetical protein
MVRRLVLTSLVVRGRLLGNPLVVGFNLWCGGMPRVVPLPVNNSEAHRCVPG